MNNGAKLAGAINPGDEILRVQDISLSFGGVTVSYTHLTLPTIRLV